LEPYPTSGTNWRSVSSTLILQASNSKSFVEMLKGPSLE
jgi:hypothetical protein